MSVVPTPWSLGYKDPDQPRLCEEILSQKPKTTIQKQTFQISFFSFIISQITILLSLLLLDIPLQLA